MPVAEERPTRTPQLVVVHRRDDWDRGVATGVQDRRRYQGEGVVDVDDIRRELVQRLGDRTPRVLAPEEAGRQCRASERRPVGNLLATPLEEHHLVSARREGGRLLVDDCVLAAGCSRPVAVVNDEELHRRAFRRVRRTGTPHKRRQPPHGSRFVRACSSTDVLLRLKQGAASYGCHICWPQDIKDLA
jgi:hypothetical protein